MTNRKNDSSARRRMTSIRTSMSHAHCLSGSSLHPKTLVWTGLHDHTISFSEDRRMYIIMWSPSRYLEYFEGNRHYLTTGQLPAYLPACALQDTSPLKRRRCPAETTGQIGFFRWVSAVQSPASRPACGASPFRAKPATITTQLYASGGLGTDRSWYNSWHMLACKTGLAVPRLNRSGTCLASSAPELRLASLDDDAPKLSVGHLPTRTVPAPCSQVSLVLLRRAGAGRAATSGQ